VSIKRVGFHERQGQALLWAVIVGLAGAFPAIVLVGLAIWVIGLGLLGRWAIYRIARGWVWLRDRLPMPVPT
jgi:uncharacterized membrane protein